jgi:hypothetical protein
MAPFYFKGGLGCVAEYSTENKAIEKLAEKMDDMREDLIQIKTKMDMVSDMNAKLDAAAKTADEALQSTRGAHKRIDKQEQDITWLWRTVVGGLIVGGIGGVLGIFFAFMKGGGV